MFKATIESGKAVVLAAAVLTATVGSALAQGAAEEVALPHTFEAGTPARASEVNDNFRTLAEAASANAAKSAENSTRISGLESSLGEIETALESLALPSNVITVGRDGADFTSVAEALSFTGDAGEDNPMLVRVLPGIFEESELVRVPAFVRLQGSGRGITVIRASRSSTQQNGESAVVELEDRASLSDLTIVNTGAGSTFAIGILAFGASRATIVRNVESSADGEGGTGHFGMRISESDITIVDSVLRASGASTVNTALGSTDSNGAFAQPLVKDSLLDGDGVNSGFGIQMTRTAIDVRDSEVSGQFRAISTSVAGISRVKNSRVETLGLAPVYQQTGSGAILSDNVFFVGGNAEGLASRFRYVHCVKANFAPVVNGDGSTVQP